MTPRQAELVSFISKFWREHGCAPSYEVIALELGYLSKSAVYRNIEVCCARGILTKEPRKARSVRVVGEAEVFRAALDLIASGTEDPVALARKVLDR